MGAPPIGQAGSAQFPSDTKAAPLAANSSLISFAFQGVQPPSTLYIDVDDQLVLSAATTQTGEVVTVNVRLLLPNGRLEDMQFTIRPLNTRAVLTSKFSLAQGYILSISAATAIATTRGQTFARVSIQRSASGSGQPAQMLFADYVTTLATGAYPGGRILAPTEGPGNVTSAAIANPGAGLDFTVSLPANTRWRIRALRAAFAASAAVANRQIDIDLVQNSNQVWRGDALVNVTAGQNVVVSVGGIVPYTSIITTDLTIPIPPDVVLSTGAAAVSQIGSVTTGIQAGDQWSGIAALIEEWLDNV